MKLSNQAMGAIMMALQKSLLEQSDIVPVLESFDFKASDAGVLTVTNAPSFKVDDRILEKMKEQSNVNTSPGTNIQGGVDLPSGSD